MFKQLTLSIIVPVALIAVTVSACKKKDDPASSAKPSAAPTAAPGSSTAAKPTAVKTPAATKTPVAVTKTPVATPVKAASADGKSPAAASSLTLIPIRNAKLRQGVLVGGHPTSEQLTAASRAGYKTIINLQMPTEPGVAAERALARQLGISYVSIPVAGAAGMTEPNARALAKALSEAKGPTIVHCASGNRVGGLYGLKAFYVDKRPAAEAFALAKATGMTSLTEVVRKILGL